MELIDAIARRRMVRDFEPDPIAPPQLDDLLDRARRAPSAGNTSAVGFVVLDRPDAVARYWDTTLPPGRRRDGFRWQGLLAVDAGLGACLFGPFDHESALRKRFGLDPGRRLVATIALGRPRPDEPGRSSARPRPPIDEIVLRPGSDGSPAGR